MLQTAKYWPEGQDLYPGALSSSLIQSSECRDGFEGYLQGWYVEFGQNLHLGHDMVVITKARKPGMGFRALFRGDI